MKLHQVIRLAQTSERRFRTLRLTIRDWSQTAAVCRAQGIPYDGEPDATGEGLVRLWLEPPARRRVETGPWAAATDGKQTWVLERDSGSVSAPPADDWHVDVFGHFADVQWLTRRGVELVGPTEVAGRSGIELTLDPERASTRFWLLPGTDRYRLVLDAERGVLLRAECFFEGELISVEEAVEIAFDEDLPGELFAEPEPR